MRSLSAAVFLLVAASGLAHGDIIVVQQVEGEGKTGQMQIEIKGAQVRIDLSPDITILRNTETGDEWTLMRKEKAFLRVTPEATAALRDEVAKSLASEPASKLVATGRHERVGNLDTDIYTAQAGELKATYWIAPKFPGAAAILTQMGVLEEGTMAELSRGLLPALHQLPGMPVRTQIVLQQRKTTTTILSAREEPVSEDRFAIPADFRELPTAILPPKTP